MFELTSRRSTGLFQFITGGLLPPNFYAVQTTLTLVILFSCLSMILIHYYFEKTQAPEIIYIAFFSVSLSLEVTRFIIPMQMINEIPALYQLIAAKVLLFSRFFGVFSLFTASVCSTGLNIQKSWNIITANMIAALIIALGASIDTQNWDTGFNIIRGYTSLFRLIEAISFITTIMSFFVAASTRSTPEYRKVGFGAMLALAGRSILLTTDTWAGPLPGIVLLAAGTWLICTSLHKIYLWR